MATIGIEPEGVAPRNSLSRRLLTAICALVLSVILVAGLWPFHAPRNGVSWLSQGSGLLFGKHGSIVSASPFEVKRSQTSSPCSLEIWLEPSRVNSGGTVLAFYWPTDRVAPFVLRQFVSGLELRRRSRGRSVQSARIYVDDVFSHLRPIFLTISSGEAGTAIYVDGTLVKRSASFRLSSEDLTGQLIMGNAPSASNNWSGYVKRLVLYDRELSSAEVLQHFSDSTKTMQAVLAKGVSASYFFSEGKGDVIHNQVDSGPNLLIPERYFIIHEQFLELPWSEFHSRWSYWVDVVVNIAGFMPLGFFFRACFAAVRKVKRPTWTTIAVGFAVSLTIEVLQGFLPTRDSGITDLFTNTSGTALGAILFAWSTKYNWLARAGRLDPLAAVVNRY